MVKVVCDAIYTWTGYAGYIASGVLVIGLIDIIVGSPLVLRLFQFMECSGYPNLVAKYRDPYRFRYSYERAWVYANYKEYLSDAWRERDFQQVRALKRAKKDWDYISLYNLMKDWDGDLDSQIIL